MIVVLFKNAGRNRVDVKIYFRKRDTNRTSSSSYSYSNARNISQQNMATLLDCFVGWCEGAGQTRATSCNIQKCCNQNFTISEIYQKPCNTLKHFATGWPNAWNTSHATMSQGVARVWADHVIYFVLLVLCYFKKCFLSCGIEPLHEQSLSRWSPILSTNLPARRLSVCLQTRFYWTLLWNGWVITLSYIFHVSFFSILISPLKTSHMKGWTNQHRFFKIYKPHQNTVDSLFWYLQHSLKYM